MKFKNKQDYLNQREAAMNDALALKNEGKLEEATAKLVDVETLDNAWKEQEAEEAKALANQAAFENRFSGLNLSNFHHASQPRNGVEGAVLGVENNQTEEDVYINAWAKDMMGLSLSAEEQNVFDLKNAALSTDTTGVLIPETVVKGIWQEAGEMYPLWADVSKTYVKGNLSIIKGETSSDAAWYDEETSTTDGSETFGQMNLTGCELSRSITVTWKLKEMAVEEFIPYIKTKLAERMGAALGYGVAIGKGKPGTGDTFKEEPKGIITALLAEDDTPRVVTYTTASYETITTVLSKVKSAYARGLSIYATNETIWTVLANIKDGNGRPIFIPDATSGGVGRIFGKVVKEDDSIPTGGILFANAQKGYHANVNKGITLDSEDHKKARTTDYIAYAIVDGDVVTTEAFAYLKK